MDYDFIIARSSSVFIEAKKHYEGSKHMGPVFWLFANLAYIQPKFHLRRNQVIIFQTG